MKQENQTPYEQGFYLGVAFKEKHCYNSGTALNNNQFPVMSKPWIEFNKGWKDAY